MSSLESYSDFFICSSYEGGYTLADCRSRTKCLEREGKSPTHDQKYQRIIHENDKSEDSVKDLQSIQRDIYFYYLQFEEFIFLLFYYE